MFDIKKSINGCVSGTDDKYTKCKKEIETMLDDFVIIETNMNKYQDTHDIIKYIKKVRDITLYTKGLGYATEDRILTAKYVQLEYLAKKLLYRLKNERPLDFIKSYPVSVRNEDDRFILDNAHDTNVLLKYIDKKRNTLRSMQKSIEFVSRLLFTYDLITTAFKDMCYCVKDKEQYARYITIVRDKIRSSNVDGLLETSVIDIVKSALISF